MKKFFIFFTLLLTIGAFQVNAYNLEGLTKDDGTPIYYRGTNIQVQIPDTYQLEDSDFRAVWITHITNDIPTYSSEAQYKSEMESVFEVMEYYNLNAMIFHVRSHNNAYYKSSLNPVASYFKYVNFDVFDPLEWIIEQCHIRGIEFHAWMNPYRVSSSYYGSPLPSVNPASNPEYLISGILNPGEPYVRDFLVDTVMELIENYDVDAIHFDDYFYVKGIDDQATRNKYNTEGLSIEDFRRKQVDLFIEDLHNTMEAYNLANNRVVQLGISPSGIYRNGSYVAPEDYQYGPDGSLVYPLGSNTAGMMHYDDYLYADTKKWVDQEWIDYIIPQTYWAFDHPVAGFADLMDWWSMVVKNKKVNLYSGMGLYMIDGGTTYSWKSAGGTEALKQILYGAKHPEIKGYSIFSYKHLKYAYSKTGNALYNSNFSKVKNEAWNSPAILPETRTYQSVNLPQVTDFKLAKSGSGQLLSFNALDGAKFYVIYRSSGNLTYASSEVIDIVGAKNTDQIVSYTDNNIGDYNYGIKAMSSTNTLGASSEASEFQDLIQVVFKDYDGSILKIDYVELNGTAVAPSNPVRQGYNFIGWDQDYTKVTAPLVVTAQYDKLQYTVRFYDNEDKLIETVQVPYQSKVTPPTILPLEGYNFIGWDHPLDKITTNLDVRPVYEIKKFMVNFIGLNGEILKKETVEYKKAATPPIAPIVDGYIFTGWDNPLDEITTNLDVRPVYAAKAYSVRFIGINGEVLKEETVEYKKAATAPEAPIIEGYLFTGWDHPLDKIITNLDIRPVYEVQTYSVRFIGIYGEVLKTEIVEYKKDATAPEAPAIKGYFFTGWNQEFSEVVEDLEVNAIYEKRDNKVASCSKFNLQFSIFPLAIILYLILRRRK